MKFHPSNPIQITLICLVLMLSYSCNKDSDLLAEYVVENPEIALSETVVTLRNSSVIIKPSGKYSNGNSKKSTITDVSTPSIGTAVINEDNSITYTPDTDITGTDEFNYTTDVTNTDNTITQETGSITVTITDENPISTEPEDMGELKAFPGAEGFGKNATGGRGGKVIFVTNLNASGAGSLRAALESSGTRTVVFRIGGIIDLKGDVIYIENPNLTIAGETAPGDGIAIKDGSVAIYTSNVIVRHIRFRGNENPISQLRIRGSGSLYSFSIDRIIIDHCSFSWANDQTLSVVKAKDVTIQNSFFTGTIKSILAWSNKDLSVLNNIMALVDTRNITTNQQLGTYLQYEEINNYIYGFNWGVSHGVGMMGTVENNIFESSNSFSSTTDYAISLTDINPSYYETSNVEEMTYLYESGNVIDGSFNGVIDLPDSSWKKADPLYRSTYEPKPTTGLKSELLANAGAYPWNRDSVDENVIAHINAKTGTLSKDRNYPIIQNGTPYPDSDNDGMDDNWEIANNLNPKDSSDGQKDRNGDGYTNLEEFLHSLTQK